MKVRLLVAIALAAFLSFAFAPRADAQFSITISFDENGNGLFTNTAGFSQALPFAQQTDPGPGGLAGALTYGLLNPPGLVGGDLVLLENGTTIFSDLIRFNPNESVPGQPAGAAVFYSPVGGGSLADIGLASVLNLNLAVVSEINGFATYTPTAGQPGFVTGAGGPVTYDITSDIPVPATLPLFASGLAGLGLLVWLKNRKAKAA